GGWMGWGGGGNPPGRHGGGHFRDAGGGWHAWAVGETDNRLAPWGRDEVAVELYGRPGAAYELCVLDSAGREVGRCATRPGPADRLRAAGRVPPPARAPRRLPVRHLR